jgi:glycosyltransferase involved in cell wall biosynthesis
VRVVCISSLEGGGPVTHMRDLLPRVAAAGADVELACQSESVAEMFRRVGIPTRVLPLRSKWDVFGALRMRRLLAGADVVHTHDRRAWLLAGPLARRLGARLVHTYHGVPEELACTVGRHQPSARAPIPFMRRMWLLHGHLRIERWLARLGTVIVPSRAMAQFLLAHGFVPRQVEVLYSRIDPRRREPGVAHSPLAVGVSAVLTPRKGIDLLVSACARLSVPTRLHIFGDGEMRGPLEEQARRVGVDTTFHGWVSDVRDHLESLDLFVLPSRGENFPIAILEAMAAALPVVATRVGGIPELVVDGVTGVLVEPEDVDALRGALDALATDPVRRATLGRQGAMRIERAFDSAMAGPTMLRLYRRLCASST